MKRMHSNLFIWVVVFLNLGNYALAEEINWSLGNNSTVAASVSGTNYWSKMGNGIEVKDNNIETSYGANCFAPPISHPVTSTYSSDCTIILTQPAYLNRIEISHSAIVSDGSENWYVDVYYDDKWYNVLSGSGAFEQKTDSVSEGWDEVSKIRVRSNGDCYNHPGLRASYTRHLTSELRAWGLPPCTDIGLRVFDGTDVVRIACEPEGTLTSPLRIKKNGIIYGIFLVNSSSAKASKVKIKVPSGIKALRRL